MLRVPSPAVAFVGRHNSGKTTLVEKLIAELVGRGLDVGSVKHHSRCGFEIDYPGKDSYRHRAAGASETVIVAPDQMACIKTLTADIECADIVANMPGHDIVIVEGYRKSGLPTIEIMRAANPSDARAAEVFAEAAEHGWPLDEDFTQLSRELHEGAEMSSIDVSHKLPDQATVALVTDISLAADAAEQYGIPHFGLEDVADIVDFLENHYVRPKVTVVIQAGGESRRMGQSKACVPFLGRPLICRLIERLAPAADELIITTNEAEKLGFIAEEYPELDIRLVKDEYDYRGALPGLYTALKAASNPIVAVVACDMVFASARLVLSEAERLIAATADVCVPVNKHGFEPFHAVYLRRTCLPAIEKKLAEGEKKAQSFFDDVKVYRFSQAQVLAAEPMGGCFINANTPDELRALEKVCEDQVTES